MQYLLKVDLIPQVSLSDFLTLFSARTQDDFFWSNKPGSILFCAAMLSLTISTILACAWPEGMLDHIPVMGLARGDYKLMPLWVWMYCLLFWIIQDSLKVSCLLLIQRYQLFEQLKPNATCSDSLGKTSTEPVGNGLAKFSQA